MQDAFICSSAAACGTADAPPAIFMIRRFLPTGENAATIIKKDNLFGITFTKQNKRRQAALPRRLFVA